MLRSGIEMKRRIHAKPVGKTRRALPKRRSAAAAVLPKFKAKVVPDRRRKALESRLGREARAAIRDD
jgi:hypothetical protein